MTLSVVAALVVALLIALHRAVHRLPLAIWSIARRERSQDDGRSLDAMKEAVAARAGQALIAVQTYQDQLANSLRAQLAEAETRARIAERRASDTVTALEAASTLVRDLRAAIDAAAGLARELRTGLPRPALPATLPSSTPPPAPHVEAEDPDRKTTEMPSPPAPQSVNDNDDGGFGDDEETRVANRPASLARVRRPRLIPLPGGAAKPRSPTVLPPAPGRDER
jgi:hypothetical protein